MANNYRSNKKSKSKPQNKPYTRGKGGRRFEEKEYDTDTKSTEGKGLNDASWYAANPQLLKDAASISFNNALGVKLDLGLSGYANPTDPGNESIPGVMAFKTHLCPGVSTDNSSAVNIAARNIYSFVRHKNSGSANYDSPDLMLYLLAMDNIYAFYNHMKRLYGVAMQYNIKNRYMPTAILNACGLEDITIIRRLAELRYYINAMASKINTLAVPASMPYMVRHSWMFSNVYADSADAKAQNYVFFPDGFYTYNEFEGAGKLEWNSVPKTLDGLYSFGDEMLSKIIESEDMNIMSGDILKAYGEGGTFMVQPVTEDYAIRPVYNQEVLSQIHNISILPSAVASTLDITQDVDSNTIIFNPTFQVTSFGYELRRILDMRMESPEPADVMVATRLMALPRDITVVTTATSQGTFTLEHAGSEFICGCYVYYFTSVNDDWDIDYIDVSLIYNSGVSQETSLGMTTMITKFDWHPCIYLVKQDTSTPPMKQSATSFLGMLFEVDNYTIIDHLTLGKMHDTAILSEFGIGN